MKILHVISRFDVGGAEKSLVELCNSLSKHNEIIICAFKKFDKNGHIFNNINKNIQTIEFNKINKLAYLEFIKYVKKEKPEIVHGHLSPIIILLLLSKLFFNYPKYYYTVHYNTSEFRGYFNKLLYILTFSFLKIKVVSISKITESNFKSVVKKVQSIVIYNGIEPIPLTNKKDEIKTSIIKLKQTHNTKILITVGRIVPVKNYTLLITAVNSLVIKGFDIILVVIGTDTSPGKEEINKLKKLASKNIYFFGEQSNIGDYLVNADLFCLSSLDEALPTVLIEACSIGLPIISTNVGGVSEIVEGNYNGFISSNMEIDNYANCIEKFLNLSSTQIETMKCNALEIYNSKFTIDRMEKEYINLYNDAL